MTVLLTGIVGAVAALIPAVVLYFLKERRKAEAESDVAERTVESQVQKADVSAIEAHMIAVERAVTMERDSNARERESKDRQLAAMQAEVIRIESTCNARVQSLETAVALKDGQILGLQDEVAHLTIRLQEVTAELQQLRALLQGDGI